MKSVLFGAIFSALSLSALATGDHSPKPPSGQPPSGQSTATAGSSSGASATNLTVVKGGDQSLSVKTGDTKATAAVGDININVSATGGKGGKGGKGGSARSRSGGRSTGGGDPSTPGNGGNGGGTGPSGGTGGGGGTGGNGTGSPSGLYGSVVEWKVDNGGKINNVPALSNTYVSTSNTCDGYTGLTAAIAGGGFGLNFASQRTFCELRLAGMAYQAMNEPVKAVRMIDLSVQLLCKSDSNLAKLAVEECKEVPEKAPDAPNPAYQSAG
jgi:hypothetical protein